MVVRVQIGYSPHMGILVLRFGFFFRLFFVFRDVVDALLVFFSVGVDHRSSVTASRITFSLHVPFLLTIAAHDVGVARAVAARRARAASLRLVRTAGRLTTYSGDLVEILGLQFVPENGSGLLGWHDGLESSDFAGALSVILDGLELPGELKALLKVSLAGFQNSVTQRVLDAGQEKLMFEKQGHVVNAFGFYLGLSGAGSYSGPDGSDGGRFVVQETVVSDLNAAQEVVHRLVRVLF